MVKVIYRHIMSLAFGVIFFFCLASCKEEQENNEKRILVFSKTEGFRHQSIPDGIEALQNLGKENGFEVDTSENSKLFTEGNLKNYSSIVFLNTTGDILDQAQKAAFERYIQAGGGFLGIHSATDTEYNWPWYGKLVGGYFNGHPEIQDAVIDVIDKEHPSTEHLPDKWKRKDEWYNFKNLNPEVKVLATLNESSYKGGKNPDHHPIVWYHEFDGGRSFYTGGGHTSESYQDSVFLQHLLGALQWTMGGFSLEFSKAKYLKVNEEDRFSKMVLRERLDEPVDRVVMDDGRIIFIERGGAVKIYFPEENETTTIASIPVNLSSNTHGGGKTEDGLLGFAIDPDFKKNGFIYLYYSPIGNDFNNILSRFILNGDYLDVESEVVLLEVPVQKTECCQTGGAIAFDREGNLSISTGDTTFLLLQNTYL